MAKGARGDYAGAWEAFLAAPVGVIAQIGAESLPQSLPGLALSTLVGPVAGMGIGSATSEYLSSVVEGLQDEGLDLAKPETLDRLRDPAVLERVRTRAAVRAAVIGAFDGASGGLLGRSLLPELAAGAGRVRRVARGAVELGAQAAAQGTIGAAGEAAGELAVGDRLDPVQIAAEFFGEFAGAPGEVATAALHHRIGAQAQPVIDDARRVAQAGQDQAKLDALVDAAGASRLRERDPERFRELLQAQTAGTPVESVHIPADAFVAYFQSAGLDPETLAAELPDVMAQLPGALASGGDLVIPAADYLARLAPDHHAGLREDIRVGADGLTPREAQAVEAGLPAALDRAAEEAVATVGNEDGAERSARAVHDDVRQQLVAAGRAPAVAEREATVWRAFFRTMGERAGVDPLELYQSYGLRVRRELPAALRDRDVGEMDLLIERLRAKRSQSQKDLHGPSLLEFVADAGGVIDEGGDLRSQDADRWHKGKAFRRRLLRDDGVPLDAMAEKAWEAGYFPEWGDERPDINTLLDAMQGELRGQRRFADRRDNTHDADVEAATRDLERVLDELGVDVATAPNADIKRALDAGRDAGRDDGQNAGAVYDQAAGAPVATLTGDELAPADTELKALRTAAKAFYNGTLRGTDVFNASLGATIRFVDGRKAFATSANPEKLRLFAALSAIVEKGTLIRSAKPEEHKTEQNVKAYHWIEATVSLGGRPVRVGVTVREDNNGNFYYNHNPVKDEGPASSAGTDPAHKAGGGTPEGEAFNQDDSTSDDGINLVLSQRKGDAPRGRIQFGRGRPSSRCSSGRTCPPSCTSPVISFWRSCVTRPLARTRRRGSATIGPPP